MNYTLHRNDIIPCIRASHYKHNLIEMPNEIDVSIVHRLFFIGFNYYYCCYYVSPLFSNYQCEFVKGFGETCKMHTYMTATLQLLPFNVNCN